MSQFGVSKVPTIMAMGIDGKQKADEKGMLPVRVH